MKRAADGEASTRGGQKLAAAFALWDLAGAVRGATAIDVGASTGGFTDVLLARGAARVTAIDVGHGQLLPRLRADARVELIERADFKTLALARAPGPYDFFTVDVSFVAARSMLRGLAFRLREGAEGVVLVKPQFEVPVHLVKGGDVSGAGLRARALAAFVTKAEALGFEIVAHADSPVTGGEGTVEILAHVRFRGRTARLPARPGQAHAGARAADAPARAGARVDARVGKAARAVSFDARTRWFASAAPGLEAVVAEEVARLPGVSGVDAVKGGVEFAGDLALGMAANLRLRVATRVVARLGVVTAREFSKLRRLAGKLPWQRFVDPARPLRFEVSQRGSRLYHTGAVAETLALAIADRIGAKVTIAPRGAGAEEEPEDATPALRIFARGESDAWTFSVDSSGELLHRRGWRTEAGAAPLRETLAAGVLALCGYDPARPLCDLMCGAGTFVIEAAAIAAGRAPGTARGFALEGWPGADAAVIAAARAAAVPAVASAGARAGIVGFDRDEQLLARARRNAERAGVGAAVSFVRAEIGAGMGDVEASAVPAGAPGLVVVNPPYGRRLAHRAVAARLVRAIGRVLTRRFPGWRAGVLVADAGWVPALGLPVRARHALENGGVPVELVVVDVPG